MKIGVFCSANNNIAAEYFAAARQLGQWIVEKKHTLIFGGTNSGLMECIGQTVHQGGRLAIGVIPDIVERGSRRSDSVDVDIPCGSLSQRKDLMMGQSDVMVALPGGIGTLDEVFSVASSNTIGYHNKRVIIYNVNGFWNPLIDLLDYLQCNRMIRGDYHNQLPIANTFGELTRLIEEAAG